MLEKHRQRETPDHLLVGACWWAKVPLPPQGQHTVVLVLQINLALKLPTMRSCQSHLRSFREELERENSLWIYKSKLLPHDHGPAINQAVCHQIFGVIVWRPKDLLRPANPIFRLETSGVVEL